jgi:hypothetical protein
MSLLTVQTDAVDIVLTPAVQKRAHKPALNAANKMAKITL